MTELEKSMAEIANVNCFDRLEIAYCEGEPAYFYASVYWTDDAARYGVQCANGMGETISIAVTGAITVAASERTPALADEAIQLGEAA